MKTVFKLIYYQHDNVDEALVFLEKIKKSSLPIDVEREVISDQDRADAIKRELFPIAVLGKMRIHQTKSGLLYPHLLVYRDSRLSTFYPRRRKGEPDITIEQFLRAVLTQNQRDDLVTSFFTTGRDCVESAEFLYHRMAGHGRYEILLIQGIESLLSSFIIFKERGDPLDIIETMKRYRHEYKKFYNHCKHLDDSNVLQDANLEYIINDLSASFSPGTIDARYPKVGLIRFMPSYFPLLKKGLIEPLQKIYFP